MTDKKDTELRITFTTIAFNVSSVLTALNEEAFKRNLPSTARKIGGIFEQTYGVTVTGKKVEVDKFDAWFQENAAKICETPLSKIVKDF